jgi:putative flippase GtrA
MSDLIPSGGGPPSRRQREKRAYQLVMVGGGSGLVAVVTAVLAVIGILGWGLPVAAALLAVVCAILFRRTVGT